MEKQDVVKSLVKMAFCVGNYYYNLNLLVKLSFEHAKMKPTMTLCLLVLGTWQRLNRAFTRSIKYPWNVFVTNVRVEATLR